MLEPEEKKELIEAAETFDWGQPNAAWAPCFHFRKGQFCGRAPWWDGHNGSHTYVSLADLLRKL
jgi:hypothetical protein